ncbi:MAG: sensor histidine kinase [Anaerolineae bacterium]
MLVKNATTPSNPTQIRSVVRWLALGGWMLVVLANLLFFLFDLALDYAQMLVPCAGVLGMGGACNFLAISSAEAAVLLSWGLTLQIYAVGMLIPLVILLLVYWALGGLILWRQGASRLGLTVSLALIVLPVSTVSGSNDWSGNQPALVFLAVAVAILGNVIMISFLYLLPNGRFSPPWAYIPLTVTITLLTTLSLDINGIIALSIQTASLLQTLTVGLVLFGGSLQVYRYLHDANTEERLQTKWIIFGVLSYVLAVMMWVLIFGSALAIPAGHARLLANLGGWFIGILFLLLILPAAITIAILRYKLWNIDIIINRTLVYSGLTLVVVLLYTLIVGGLSLLFQTSGNLVISLIATGLIAVAFHPVRERLQRGVNRMMFGERDDPYAVLSRLGQQVQSTAVPAETLTIIVETIAGALKLPYAAIELVARGAQVGQAAVGEPVGEVVALPLSYQKETVGRLLVSPRAESEAFTLQEEQLLADIAAQTGPAASATRLTLALQRSREKLALAREEERRRIRRDLHDGFGPTLASQTLKLDETLDLLAANDPQAAGRLVKQLKSQTQQMVADIRRLVYELRPPALDELGLLEALRAHVAQTGEVNGNLRIAIEAMPEPLPPLPAAIEVAAYRIALEGVTNVIRHAQASDCHIGFVIAEGERPSTLVLTIIDDGLGLPANLQSGVGLTSMRERAEELGGMCEVGSNQNGGTRVIATLPLTARRDA